MTRLRSYLTITMPACLVIAAAVHFLARSADPQGCGWGHWGNSHYRLRRQCPRGASSWADGLSWRSRANRICRRYWF